VRKRAFQPLPKPFIQLGRLREGEPIDFIAWQEQFVATGVIDSATVDPIADVLRGLNRYEPAFAILREAALRPRSQFMAGWEKGLLQADIGHQGDVINLTHVAGMRILTLLALGETAQAMAEWRVTVKLVESFEAQPSLYAVMIRTMLVAQSMRVAWGILTSRTFSGDRLVEIEAHFEAMDLRADVRFGFATERALFNSCVLEMKRLPRNQWRERFGVFFGDSRQGAIPVSDRIMQRLPYCIPRGWLSQNQIRLNQFHDDQLNDAARRELLHSPRSPYAFIAQAWVYMLGDNEQFAAEVQNDVQLFRIALALNVTA
jgi:hypothetical protein